MKAELQFAHRLMTIPVGDYPGSRGRNPNCSLWSLTHRVDAVPGTLFPAAWVCRYAVTQDFPELIKSGCWAKPKLVMRSLLFLFSFQFSSVQLLSRVQLFGTPWTAAHQASPSITNSQSLLKLKSVMPSNHLILYRPLLLLPSIFPSMSIFSNQSALRIRWPKYWSSSFNISPSSEYSGLISFRMDRLNLFAVQGTLKSLLQPHSSKASILCSAFFMVQLSHLYMTTGKTIALTR